ncbi:MAG TPA: ABC transporter ATP-binding protein [Pyrinomonadaceae bacterium]|nr:ABC transporter ATP-binding protein [Pyrinomonadaceae bacterium]
MKTNLIEVEGVTKRYGELVAVGDMRLSVAAGEVYGLVGANGAGKSTLIRMIVGITTPDAGSVRICGEDLRRHILATKKHLGYLPEELFLYNRLTGEEYLRLVAGLKETDAGDIASEIEFFELSAVAGKWAGSYSLGMRKKLGLAAAFTGRAQVLVLDEPLNGLDVEMMRKLRLRIERERDRGCAVLVSSHVMSFVERICGRVGIMRAGRLVAEGTPDELRRLSTLADAPFEDVFFHLAKQTMDDGQERTIDDGR